MDTFSYLTNNLLDWHWVALGVLSGQPALYMGMRIIFKHKNGMDLRMIFIGLGLALALLGGLVLLIGQGNPFSRGLGYSWFIPGFFLQIGGLIYTFFAL